MRLPAALCLALPLSVTAAQAPLVEPQLDPLQDPAPQPVEFPVFVTGLDVQLQVDGPTLQVRQAIELTNHNAEERDFDLIYPLGSGTLISGLTLEDGDWPVAGALYGIEEARSLYRSLARDRRDAALLEHYGEAVFRARVADVPPGGTKVVHLEYTRIVKPEADLLRLHVPLTAFHRAAGPVRLTVAGEVRAEHPVTTLYSPTHALVETGSWESWDASNTPSYHTSFVLEETVSGCETDLVAYLKAPAPGAEHALLDATVLSERPDAGEDGYFLAVLNGLPDDELVPEPKNVVFVLDRSGSMEGEKFDQARAALRYMARQLQTATASTWSRTPPRSRCSPSACRARPRRCWTSSTPRWTAWPPRAAPTSRRR